MNSRMDELQAAVLRVKLPRLDGWNRRRRDIAARYGRALKHPDIVLPPPASAESDVAHLFVVRTSQRDSLRAHLAAAGVATDIHYPIPDHRQPGAGASAAVGTPAHGAGLRRGAEPAVLP